MDGFVEFCIGVGITILIVLLVGEYLDNIEEQIKEEAIERIKSLPKQISLAPEEHLFLHPSQVGYNCERFLRFNGTVSINILTDENTEWFFQKSDVYNFGNETVFFEPLYDEYGELHCLFGNSS